MALSPEQVAELKTQLAQQIKDLPQDQKAQAQKQIDDMSAKALESMLKQQQSQADQQPIFRQIIEGKIPSKQIEDNKEAIAVLDIRPISKGHTIIIPKKPVLKSQNLPTPALTLAKSLSKKICTKLKAKGTEIQTQFSFGEIVINIIPIYDKPLSINSPREEVKEEEIEEVYKILKKPPKKEVIRPRKKRQTKVIKMRQKVP